MATLKISDLSVGDWVGIDQAELNMPSDDLATAYIEKLRKPIRIKGISEDSDMVIADIEIIDEWGSIMMKCEHLCPIPITAEILEKNGWFRLEYQCVWNIEDNQGTSHDGEYVITWFADDGYLTISWGGREDEVLVERTIMECRVKYIHQLQHALRLAGIDKEINL